MNSSVKFFEPIVSVVAAFAGLRWISFEVAAAGCSAFVGLRGLVVAAAATGEQEQDQHEGCGDAAQHAAAIIPRPPDGGRGNAQDYLTKPACWR